MLFPTFLPAQHKLLSEQLTLVGSGNHWGAARQEGLVRDKAGSLQQEAVKARGRSQATRR